MEMWMKQGSSRLRFPVLPPEYTVSGSQINTVVNINAIGEVNLLGKRGLRTVSFSSFFPYRSASYCEHGSIKKPRSYVEQIEKMKRGGPLKLYISRSLSLRATIEKFDYGESDGTGDINFTLELKEYRHISIPVSVVAQTAGAQEAPADSTARDASGQEKPSTYTVVQGDTLSGIARKLTGSANWKTLYEANKGVIGGNPNLIYPGQVLTIT